LLDFSEKIQYKQRKKGVINMKKISRLILFMISLSVFAVGCSSDDDSSSFVDDNFASMPAGCESVDLRDIGTNGNNLYSMLQNEYTSFVTARCSISSSINAYTTGLESLGFSGFTGTLSGETPC
jgi:hypothetical protein